MFSNSPRQIPIPRRWPQPDPLALVLALSLVALQQPVAAQTAPADGWSHCSALGEDMARLACFDRWAAQQRVDSTPALAHGASASANPPVASAPVQLAKTEQAPEEPSGRPCADPALSPLSRFWELEPDSDCGTFGIRSHRPLSLSWIGADSVNTSPSSPSAGHSATTSTDYGTSEARIQLSVRAKIARGLLTDAQSPRRDSLWFGYTQQSYWQLFSAGISRPFRSTDHEPELTYIFPVDTMLDGGWRLRYAGLSLNHQSNGQSLPLSRSWNRIILMAGMELDDRVTLQARAWARVPEKADQDDNPDISDQIGRAELSAFWSPDNANTLGVTLHHSLRTSARGSVRLEWLRSIGTPRFGGEPGGLRFHTQLFTGYGDSLLDYNRRRTVLSLGLSLVDF